MEKLQLKQLAGYLPYGLKMKRNGFIGELLTLRQPKENSLVDYYEFQVSCSDWWENNVDDLNPYKPLLRPLSDLTKEIEVNGEKFVPIEKLRELFFKTSEIDNGGVYIETLVFKDNEFKNFTQDLCYTGDNNHEYHEPIGYKTSISIYEKLYEWHFDIHGGIGTWAIDINTLK